MSDPFVPLYSQGTQTAGAGAFGFRLKVVAPAKEPFTPVVLENPSAAPTAAPTSPASGSCAAAQPVITLQRDGENRRCRNRKCSITLNGGLAGQSADLSDNDILARLLELNLARAAEELRAPDARKPKFPRPKRDDELI